MAQDDLAERVAYDPATGVFRWKASKYRSRIGTVAGRRHLSGHISIEVNGKTYYAHRIAWLFMTGQWPKDEIDHIDGDPSNNRFDNLREATHAQNLANRRNRRPGLKGASFDKKLGKWQSYIHPQGRKQSLGYFNTAEEAHAAYVAKAKEVFGDFARAA
jgi:HNH endonuclease/AP2 domain